MLYPAGFQIPFKNLNDKKHAPRTPVHYQYQSPVQLKELLGYAGREASSSGNSINILLPGVNNSNLGLWTLMTKIP